MKSKQEIENMLAHCTGSEHYHRWSILFPDHLLTDGVKALCEAAECYWLVDAISSYTAEHSKEEFQCWDLTVKNGKALLEGEDGNEIVLETQDIEHTDFPLPNIKIFCQLGSLDGTNLKWILLLPSEY